MSAFCLLILFCLDGGHESPAPGSLVHRSVMQPREAFLQARARVVLFTRLKSKLVFPRGSFQYSAISDSRMDAIFPKRYCTIGIISHYFLPSLVPPVIQRHLAQHFPSRGAGYLAVVSVSRYPPVTTYFQY